MRIRGSLLLLAATVAMGAFGSAAASAAPGKQPVDGDKPVVHIAPGGAKTRASGSGGVGGDFTGDGRADILTRSSGGHLSVYHYLGYNNAPAYGPISLINAGWQSMTWLGAGDMNGDGLADVVSTDGGGVLRIAVSDPASAPALLSNQVVGTGWGINDYVTIADYNGDGFDDLLGRRAGTTNVYLYLNNGGVNGTATFAPPQLAISGITFKSLYIADMTLDGSDDVLFIRPNGNMAVYDIAVDLTYLVNLGWNSVDQVSVTEANGDGRPDLLARRVSDGALLFTAHSGSWAPAANGTAYSTLRPSAVVGFGWSNFVTIT